MSNDNEALLQIITSVNLKISSLRHNGEWWHKKIRSVGSSLHNRCKLYEFKSGMNRSVAISFV